MICLIVALTAPLALVYASFSEWWLHKSVMHRTLWGFEYSFKAHALTHHRIFRADQTYHLTDPKRKDKKIRMAWWNAPAIIAIGGTPWYLGALLLGMFWRADAGWAVGATCLVVWFGYYAAYEVMHWCMHWPKGRWLESTRVFQFLDKHHRLHHQHTLNNLNVVLPLADWQRGTLLR